ncbi:phage tail tape measure protein [Vibrio scophthalmi]|uniref:phage tail tape measure protein n=1 Tax=Vibrio scophthalmi TaxID=45658 RepID=UPI003AADB519
MNNNYALSLVVGVKNQFTKGSKDIQDEYKKLSTSHNKLKANLNDVNAYKKADAALKEHRDSLNKMGTPTEEAQLKLQHLTRELRQQSRALKRAGIDTDQLAEHHEKLQKQLRKTASEMNNVKPPQMPSAETLAGAGVGLATGGAIVSSGLNTNQVERQAAAAINVQPEQIQGWRNALTEIETQTARPYEELVNARIQAMQSGYDEQASLELTQTSAQLSSAFKNLNWQPQEVMSAQMRLMKSFDISAQKAADLIAITAQKSGDDKGDLLDSLSEYSSTYAGHGLSVESVFAQYIAGRQAGTWNYDKVGDSIKEMLQARMSDPDEFKKLVGDGKTAGSVDTLIKDQETAESFKSALFGLRNAMQTGDGIDTQYGHVMGLLSDLYKSDKGAARNIAEGVGGNIFAEDIGEKGIHGIAQAANNPLAILGDYQGALSEAIDVAITPSQKLVAEFMALGRAVSTVVTDIENLASGALGSLGDGIASIREEANESTLISGALAASTLAGLGYGSARGSKMAMGVFKKWSSGAITTPDVDLPNTMKASKLDTLKQGVGGAFKSAGKYIKPLAIVTSAVPMAMAIKDEEYGEAGKLAGSLGGGLAGMKLGAMVGALGGPIVAAIGGVAGGAIGSIFGEKAISELLDYFSPNTKAEIESVTAQVSDAEKSLPSSTSDDKPIEVTVSVPVTIGDGAIEPTDFELQLVNALRKSTPELTLQLKETLNNLTTV